MRGLAGEHVLYCSAVLSHYLCVHGNRKKAGKQEWSGLTQSLSQSQGPYLLFHLCLTLTTYTLYYTPHPFLSQEA